MAIDAEIAAYQASGDEVLEARTSDLADLRERVLDALSPQAAPASAVTGEQAIYVAEELTPSRFLETDWTRHRGAAIRRGSAAGHVALLARARGTPLVIGLGPAFDTLRDGAVALLDTERGQLVLDPSPEILDEAKRRLADQAARAASNARFLDRPAITADGERVEVLINVDDPALLRAVDPGHTDGIGLTRTEFLFHGPDLPGETRQYEAYTAILEWAGGRPVIIRTLEAGGDKPIAGLAGLGSDRMSSHAVLGQAGCFTAQGGGAEADRRSTMRHWSRRTWGVRRLSRSGNGARAARATAGPRAGGGAGGKALDRHLDARLPDPAAGGAGIRLEGQHRHARDVLQLMSLDPPPVRQQPGGV